MNGIVRLITQRFETKGRASNFCTLIRDALFCARDAPTRLIEVALGFCPMSDDRLLLEHRFQGKASPTRKINCRLTCATKQKATERCLYIRLCKKSTLAALGQKLAAITVQPTHERLFCFFPFRPFSPFRDRSIRWWWHCTTTIVRESTTLHPSSSSSCTDERANNAQYSSTAQHVSLLQYLSLAFSVDSGSTGRRSRVGGSGARA